MIEEQPSEKQPSEKQWSADASDSMKAEIVSNESWLAARRELLSQEKEFTRLREELAQKRRSLPWRRVEKEYVFEGQDGPESLSDLFAGRSQLIVYHFMLGPDWTEGCPACSLLADHYEPAIVHLAQRDTTLVTVSRGSLSSLDAFKRRMGWDFKWVSSMGNDFNWDYRVSFSPEEIERKEMDYNYTLQHFPEPEAPGLSVFYKDEEGRIFHTYSTFARGLDVFIGAYNFLDLVPKGRDEAGLPFTMAWVRHHDRYES